MSKLTFETAKQLVAVKYGYQDWEDLYNTSSEVRYNPTSTLSFYQNAAAKLLAQNWAKEAVKDFQKRFVSQSHKPGTIGYHFLIQAMQTTPLPYPEIEK